MQSAKQFIAYFERMQEAEEILLMREKILKRAVQENKQIPKEQWILRSEFVADHLEWGSETGIVVFEIESKPVTTKYAVRFQ